MIYDEREGGTMSQRYVNFPKEMEDAIAEEARADHRKFSNEVVRLVALALESLGRMREEGAA